MILRYELAAELVASMISFLATIGRKDVNPNIGTVLKTILRYHLPFAYSLRNELTGLARAAFIA